MALHTTFSHPIPLEPETKSSGLGDYKEGKPEEPISDIRPALSVIAALAFQTAISESTKSEGKLDLSMAATSRPPSSVRHFPVEERKTKAPDSIYDHAVLAKEYAQHFIKKIFTQLAENASSDDRAFSLYTAVQDLRDNIQVDDQKITSLCINATIHQFEARLSQTKKYSMGNCEELASLALDYFATKAPHISAEIVRIINGDHIFLVVNRKKSSNINDPTTWGDQAYICDPWSDLVYPGKDYLKKDADGNTTLQDYFHCYQFRIPLSYNLRDKLPPEAYQTFASHQIIHIRYLKKGLFVCHPETGKIICKAPQCEREFIRVKNFTRSFDIGRQALKADPYLTTGEVSQSRLSANYEKKYYKKLKVIVEAVEKLYKTFTSIEKRLREKYGFADNKYFIIINKKWQLSLILHDLKSKLAAKSSSSTAEISDQLRLNLTTALQDCYKVAQFEEDEARTLLSHRHQTRVQKFFDSPSKTGGVLQSALTTFDSTINTLGQK